MNIYVGNLPYAVTETDMRDMFADYGSVTSVNVIMDRETGNSKGFGFVEMDNPTEGQKAIDELNGKAMKGRNLRVNEARPRPDRGAGGGGRGGGGGRPPKAW